MARIGAAELEEAKEYGGVHAEFCSMNGTYQTLKTIIWRTQKGFC